MKIVIPKKKKYLILLFVMLALAAVTAGIYLLVNPRGNDSISYTVDKYSDVINWCDTSTKDNILTIDCKALLINIDVDSCFEVQVITKDKELKDFNICENGDTLTYTNDVLGYKKLMPVDMIFTYSREGVLGNYSFNNVSFKKIDDTYIQNIVNEDIKNLVTKDVKSTTTIKNSVNFCPQPNQLPEFVSEEIKSVYLSFYNTSKLDETFFADSSLYNFSSDNLEILFGCESQLLSGYKTICPPGSLNFTKELNEALKLYPNKINYDQEINQTDINTLKYISIMSDGEGLMYYSDEEKLFSTFIRSLGTDPNVNENLYCGIYKYLNNIENKNDVLKTYLSYIENYINQNILKIHSSLCNESIDEAVVDKIGLYLKNYILNTKNNGRFSILNDCINLDNI